ncbi:hypothetical protein Tco_0535883 [Tanacetum coccineum]
MLKGIREQNRSLALKAKKESSDEDSSTSDSEDEEYAMAVKEFKKFFKRRGRFIRSPSSRDAKSPEAINQESHYWRSNGVDMWRNEAKTKLILITQASNEYA